MKKVVIAYIGGGSTDWAHKYFSDLLSQDELGGELRLYDIKPAAAEKNKQYFDRLVQDNLKELKSEWDCRVIHDADMALAGCDFVIISILPGTLEHMRHDVHYPQQYGIWQSVGDTAGAGGYSRALRTIPIFLYYADKIKMNCPDAWVINYTNPMSICTYALYKQFPRIKAIGCCHEVFETQSLLASIYSAFISLNEEEQGKFLNGDYKSIRRRLKQIKIQRSSFIKAAKSTGEVSRHEIKVNVQGINHFTWFNKAEYKGRDILPVYRAYVDFSKGAKFLTSPLIPAIIRKYANEHFVKFDLSGRFGSVAAAGDRHLAEFVPDLFLRDRHVYKFGFILTPVWARKLFDKYKRNALDRKLASSNPIKITPSDEEGVLLIKALSGLGDLITNVNLPNMGQVPDLPAGAVVETNARFSADGAEPLDAGVMPEAVRELVVVHCKNQKDFVDAYFDRDRKALLGVFSRDPSVSRLSAPDKEKLFNELIELNKDMLEDFLIHK